MISSTESAPTQQRTPAWAKFLKLKQPNGSVVGHQQGGDAALPPAHAPAPPAKRGPPSADASPSKRARREALHDGRNAPADYKPTKTVTFGDTPTKSSSGNSNSAGINKSSSPVDAKSKTSIKQTQQKKPQQKQAKKPKGPPKKEKPQPVADVTAAIAYLRQWDTARETWKFNKNHQTTLIKHFFDAGSTSIPASVTKPFYAYIRDLKGFVRTRLAETAMEIRTRDVADGPAAFPEGTAHREERQAAYETAIDGLLRQHRQQVAKRKIFDEEQYLADSEDVDVVLARVVKRMRAELVIDELSDSGESTDATAATSASSQTIAASEDDSDDEGTVNPNAGEKQPTSAPKAVPSRRRRKLRVNMDDDDETSSSESESDSDSDASSSSSSDDSDSDDDEAEEPNEEGYDTSSSSSSSSSSGADDGEDSNDEDSDDE
jgi:hypothetical protein